MNKKEVLQNVAKLYLAIQYAEGVLYNIKDFLKQDVKLIANRSVKSVTQFCKKIEGCQPGANFENAEEDVELLSEIIEAFIQSEKSGIMYKFKNDFYKICKQNNIKL